MWRTLGRGWEFATLSYRIIWDHKGLLIFPVISMIAAILVSISYLAPLWASGVIDRLIQIAGHGGSVFSANHWPIYLATFVFYYLNYLVIIFFNSALTACVMQVLAGEAPHLSYGLSIAFTRLPQIAGWALVAALVGTIIHSIEHAHDRAGAFIASILGSAWSAMVYFVIPILVVDGVGPIEAMKRSMGILRHNWGTALAGNFSIGGIGFLIALPVLLVLAALGYMAAQSGSTAVLIGVIALGVLCIVLICIVNSMAGTVFKALLFNWATNRNLPEQIDTAAFSQAFRQHRSRRTIGF